MHLDYIWEFFFEIWHSLKPIIANAVCVADVLEWECYTFGLGYCKVLVTGMLFAFAIMIITVLVVGVSRSGFVLGMLLDFVLGLDIIFGNIWGIINRYTGVTRTWLLTLNFNDLNITINSSNE